jgi:hypothetical protein
MVNLPKLDSRDYVVLADLREKYSHQFYTNVTPFFINEMKRYIKNYQVWRITIMGETRSGKSETAQTICFKYVSIFNDLYTNDSNFKKGINERLDKSIKSRNLKFTVNHIMASQSEHLYGIRETASKKKLVFGQIWLIDENKDQGGLGSYSEKMEQKNINNIIAKFCQSEIWLTPRNFIEANAPYGIRMYKKDIPNRCNWGLLYKIDMTPTGVEFLFLGWIKIPLHDNSKHRDEYEAKKNEWIVKEIEGGADDRMVLRHEVAKKLALDKDFCQLNNKGTNFLRNTKQQKAILERGIIEGKIQNFNEMEKETIVSFARDNAFRTIFGEQNE